MSHKRIRSRQTAQPSLPYWRSILASSVLVLSMMFSFEALSDPRSGELKSPGMIAPVLGLFVLAEAAVFYAEFRLRRKRPRTQRTVAWDEGDHAG